MDAPASRARLTSFAYSSGVYGMPGHCCLFATAPETAHVMMQGSSTDMSVLSGLHRIRFRRWRLPEVLADHFHLAKAHPFVDAPARVGGPEHRDVVPEPPRMVDGGPRHGRADATAS